LRALLKIARRLLNFHNTNNFHQYILNTQTGKSSNQVVHSAIISKTGCAFRHRDAGYYYNQKSHGFLLPKKLLVIRGGSMIWGKGVVRRALHFKIDGQFQRFFPALRVSLKAVSANDVIRALHY
jgi:hypothetical protein